MRRFYPYFAEDKVFAALSFSWKSWQEGFDVPASRYEYLKTGIPICHDAGVADIFSPFRPCGPEAEKSIQMASVEWQISGFGLLPFPVRPTVL